MSELSEGFAKTDACSVVDEQAFLRDEEPMRIYNPFTLDYFGDRDTSRPFIEDPKRPIRVLSDTVIAFEDKTYSTKESSTGVYATTQILNIVLEDIADQKRQTFTPRQVLKTLGYDESGLRAVRHSLRTFRDLNILQAVAQRSKAETPLQTPPEIIVVDPRFIPGQIVSKEAVIAAISTLPELLENTEEASFVITGSAERMVAQRMLYLLRHDRSDLALSITNHPALATVMSELDQAIYDYDQARYAEAVNPV